LKAWAPWHGQDGDFFEEEASSKIARLYHNVQPFGQGRHGQPINIRWFWFRKSAGGLRFGEGKFFLREKASYKVRSSD
jgi:hypothetical protein